jgi:hypothetical protein
MAYNFLAQTHYGWKDGEGAGGEFTFAVPGRTIMLDYGERFFSYNSYQHEL